MFHILCLFPLRCTERYVINSRIKKHKNPLWLPWKHLLIITYCEAVPKVNISPHESGVIRQKVPKLSYTNLWHLRKVSAHILDIFQCKPAASNLSRKRKNKQKVESDGAVSYQQQTKILLIGANFSAAALAKIPSCYSSNYINPFDAFVSKPLIKKQY